MYNDYYLQSIDNKLNNLSSVITNQETIINNQTSILNTENLIIANFQILFVWLITFLSALLFYNFYHRIFNHKR